MEVGKLGNAMGIYRKMENSYKTGVKDGKKVSSSAKRVDTFEMSAGARAAGAEAAKASAKKFADSDASADRIASLKSRIADGSYNVSPESVAASIFEG
ncbi:MAG: flagellar biosynthesis anti-sigma factor FlgM [Oscillospiraceae bacterium]|nr:flagellar biosynthesis anti-sigma factor FlgM [Oscillospiraceae bacterium]